jgi:hypothetical protein
MNLALLYSHKPIGSPMTHTPTLDFITAELTYQRKSDGLSSLCRMGTPPQSAGT